MKRVSDHSELYLLSYGTLRKDQYNYNRIRNHFPIKNDHLLYIDTIKLEGYKMFNLGSYPMCTFTGEKNDTVIADVLRMSNLSFDMIDKMETQAGYSRYKADINFRISNTHLKLDSEAIIYLSSTVNLSKHDSNNIIKNGDWVSFIESLQVN